MPRTRTRARSAVFATLAALLLLGAAGCGDDDVAVGSPGAGDAGADAAPVGSAERCAANRAAGTVTFVTPFDFAAAAGIIETIVAEGEGYFEELCIDVELQPGFAPANAALVIEGQAQMSSAGSFGELVNNNVRGEGDLVALLQWGKTAIEAIVIPEGSDIASFADLCGATVGIKGDLPYSLQAAVGLAGIERSCFDEVLLDGFDPIQHLDLGLDALPVYKSNEPRTLEQAGRGFTLLDPLEAEVPASFGVVFTSRGFLERHPTVVEDYLRAILRAHRFAAADPEAAVDHAFSHIDAAGNPFFFAQEQELFRWTTERDLIAATTPEGEGPGLLDLDRLEAEIELLTSVGVYDPEPDWRSMVDRDLAAGLYDGPDPIWP